jgi:hypothetical protein
MCGLSVWGRCETQLTVVTKTNLVPEPGLTYEFYLFRWISSFFGLHSECPVLTFDKYWGEEVPGLARLIGPVVGEAARRNIERVFWTVECFIQQHIQRSRHKRNSCQLLDGSENGFICHSLDSEPSTGANTSYKQTILRIGEAGLYPNGATLFVRPPIAGTYGRAEIYASSLLTSAVGSSANNAVQPQSMHARSATRDPDALDVLVRS